MLMDRQHAHQRFAGSALRGDDAAPGLVEHLSAGCDHVSLRLERLAAHVREVGQRIAAGHVLRLQELRGLRNVVPTECREVVVDRLNLVEVVHWISLVRCVSEDWLNEKSPAVFTRSTTRLCGFHARRRDQTPNGATPS